MRDIIQQLPLFIHWILCLKETRASMKGNAFPFISILIIIKLQCSEYIYTLLYCTYPSNFRLASASNQCLRKARQYSSPSYSLSIHLDCVMRQGTSNEKKIFITSYFYLRRKIFLIQERAGNSVLLFC